VSVVYPELQEKIRQAVGEASTCWENLDSPGVFDSDRANKIAASLYDYMVEFMAGLQVEKRLDAAGAESIG